jgi:hypothetical protein
MAETTEAPEKPLANADERNDDDRRAAAASVNRKRTLEDWEEKKRRWRKMGVPPAMPARK